MAFLKFGENSGLKGYVKIIVEQENKGSVNWYEDPNVVVDLGRERIAKILASETTDVVDAMIVGNGGSNPPNNISPTAPSRTDTSLNGRIGATPLQSGQTTTNGAATQPVVVTRTLNTVRYDATFNSDDLNHTDYPKFGAPDSLGLNAIFISELGLITTAASDELFARVTFAPISFQNGSSTSITVQWSITVL